MRNIKIADEEYSTSSKNYKALADDIEGRINDYLSIMADVTGSAVVSGAVSDSLKRFTDNAQMLKQVLSNILKDYSTAVEQFAKQTDSIDRYRF